MPESRTQSSRPSNRSDRLHSPSRSTDWKLMWHRYKMAIASVLMLVTLTSCVTSGTARPTYPVLPADLRVCFDQTVPAPTKGPMTKGRVMFLIGALKRSEVKLSDCGHRLVTFYDNVSKPAP